VPSNIGLVHLPPASPELNPTENVWQYVRQGYLSNRVFRDYDDDVEASSSPWNKLIAEARSHRVDRHAKLDRNQSRSVKVGSIPRQSRGL
jgi:transposase